MALVKKITVEREGLGRVNINAHDFNRKTDKHIPEQAPAPAPAPGSKSVGKG